MNAAYSEQLLAEQRPVLFRYALLQLYDTALADDAVQETLLAALQSTTQFAGKSSLRTWLIGILKHKIADHWRRSENDAPPALDRHEEENPDEEDDFFITDGHWCNKPKAWADPEAALHQAEFWAIYQTCQENLPPAMAKVFMLRELVGLEPGEICAETAMTEANYWVTMHRARLRLRECLELRWFNTEKKHA